MLIQVEQPIGVITEAPYHADPTGERDATAAVQAALDDHRVIEVPPGRYRISRSRTITPMPGRNEHVGVIVPERRRIVGHGRSSVFLTVLDDPARPHVARDAGMDNAISWFWCPAGSEGQEFESVWFEGEAPANLRYEQFISDLAMAAIELSYPTADAAGARSVRVRRCGFERQFGFSVHARALAFDVTVEDCDFIDCMNGLNINADDSQYAMNRFLRSEGMEHTGSNVQIIANRFRQAYSVGIAFGGHTGPGVHENRSYGGRLIGNVVDEASHYGYQVTINTSDTLFQGNYASRTRHHGLVVGGGGTEDNKARVVTLDANHFLDCGGPNENAAMFVGDAERVRITRNTARHGEWPGTTQQYGLLVGGGRDIEVYENDLDGLMAGLAVVGRVRAFRHARNRLARPMQIGNDVDVLPPDRR